jgi:predicted flap endonuclease-1-like 5' DNA nuclease
MAISISKLRGMSAELAAKLKARGIVYGDQLLEAARTPAGRKALAEQVGVASRVILELANRADLARVSGVAGVFSDLLEHAGVDTVKELAVRNPDNLHAKLVEINADKKLAGRTPPISAVKDWVAQAESLPKVLEY